MPPTAHAGARCGQLPAAVVGLQTAGRRSRVGGVPVAVCAVVGRRWCAWSADQADGSFVVRTWLMRSSRGAPGGRARFWGWAARRAHARAPRPAEPWRHQPPPRPPVRAPSPRAADEQTRSRRSAGTGAHHRPRCSPAQGFAAVCTARPPPGGGCHRGEGTREGEGPEGAEQRRNNAGTTSERGAARRAAHRSNSSNPEWVPRICRRRRAWGCCLAPPPPSTRTRRRRASSSSACASSQPPLHTAARRTGASPGAATRARAATASALSTGASAASRPRGAAGGPSRRRRT